MDCYGVSYINFEQVNADCNNCSTYSKIRKNYGRF